MSMVKIKRVRLDVLKPHKPNVLEFAMDLAKAGSDYEIDIRVLEMDEQTETLEVIVEGDSIPFERLTTVITELGGSLHSIDEVTVRSPEAGS